MHTRLRTALAQENKELHDQLLTIVQEKLELTQLLERWELDTPLMLRQRDP
jgi:hypothetical protein